ncbi:MAG: prenyltransferase/squalene oxidase repeat-containing protein, partial [Candidatus Bathyarchaeia archaeon]
MIKKMCLGILLATLIMGLATIPQASAFPYERNDACVANALSWLKSRQQGSGMIGSFAVSSWAAMAVAPSKDDPGKWSQPGGITLTQYLKNNIASLTSCSDYSRFILSMVTAGEDPKNVNGIDLVARLESFYTGGQFGDPSLLNDDFWAIIALISAGRYKTDEKIQSAVNFLKTNQHGSGGWSYDVAAVYGPDVDSTAAAIMALISAGEPATSTSITNGLIYMKSKQDSSGGFNGGWGTSAETDSWAIQAIISAGQDPTGPAWEHSGKTPVDDLLTFQNQDGGFRDYTGSSSEWTTSYAISALVGKPYPIIRGARTTIRIEGQSSTIWKGEVFTTWSNITESKPVAGNKHYSQPTVLGALD